MTIEKIFKHPDYDGRDFDVALVKLKTTIKYNSHVRPVCLAKTDFEPETLCFVTGWGHTSEGGNIARVITKCDNCYYKARLIAAHYLSFSPRDGKGEGQIVR